MARLRVLTSRRWPPMETERMQQGLRRKRRARKTWLHGVGQRVSMGRVRWSHLTYPMHPGHWALLHVSQWEPGEATGRSYLPRWAQKNSNECPVAGGRARK
jgi:hypothetical protein